MVFYKCDICGCAVQHPQILPAVIMDRKHYKTMYEGLLYGDPKMRVLRILWTEIYNDHNMMIKEAQRGKQH